MKKNKNLQILLVLTTLFISGCLSRPPRENPNPPQNLQQNQSSLNNEIENGVKTDEKKLEEEVENTISKIETKPKLTKEEIKAIVSSQPKPTQSETRMTEVKTDTKTVSTPILPPEKPLSSTLTMGKCLTSKGVRMYGAFWCPHCANQKKIFGDDIKNVTYIECDPNGQNGKPEECRKAGVAAYPTWYFPGTGNVEGELSLLEISKYSSCPLN